MQHSDLANGGWAALSFPQQMANIGSETSRIYNALVAGKEARAAMWEELCRFREFVLRRMFKTGS